MTEELEFGDVAEDNGIYDTQQREKLLDEDGIADWEDGFMRGWNRAG